MDFRTVLVVFKSRVHVNIGAMVEQQEWQKYTNSLLTKKNNLPLKKLNCERYILQLSLGYWHLSLLHAVTIFSKLEKYATIKVFWNSNPLQENTEKCLKYIIRGELNKMELECTENQKEIKKMYIIWNLNKNSIKRKWMK